MDHSKKSTYLFSIDALRVIAILAVILIHTTTKTLAKLNLDITLAPFSLFLNQSARFAVPLFFLISGFVLELNNKTEISYAYFFKRRASRIIIPYIFWTLIYFLYKNNLNFSDVLTSKFLKSVFLGNASYHLYFIPTLILFYLAFPFLHSVIKFLKNPVIFICVWIFEFLLLYEDYYVKQLDFSYDIRIAILTLSMFITGMVASHYKDSIYKFVRRYLLLSILLTLSLPFLNFLHVQSITLKAHTSRFIYNQYSPLNYLFTLSLFSLLYFTFEKNQHLKKLIVELSKLSLFVFFTHVLIQTVVWDKIIENLISKNGNTMLKSIFFDPFMFCVISVFSFSIAFIIHKIPFAYKITG